EWLPDQAAIEVVAACARQDRGGLEPDHAACVSSELGGALGRIEATGRIHDEGLDDGEAHEREGAVQDRREQRGEVTVDSALGVDVRGTTDGERAHRASP